MYEYQCTTFKYICSLILLIGLAFLLPVSALAENGDEEEQVALEEYVNPFLGENLDLYEEALALQGFIVPGLAYLDDNAGQDQGRHYNPLMEGFVLGRSEAVNRFDDGNEFTLTAMFEDENNSALGLRYRIGGISFRGYLDFADFATIEDTPGDVRTTWTDNRNFGFELGGGDMLFNWDHRETNREWDLSGLSDYTNDRLAFTHDFVLGCGDVDLGLIYNRLDSDELGFSSRGAMTAVLSGRFPIDERTGARLGYGGIWADKPNDSASGNYAKHTLSGSITRQDCPGEDMDVTAYANYETLSGEQTLNTHWDGRYNFGAKVTTDYFDSLKMEGGISAEYYDVDQIRYELPGLMEIYMWPGLTEDDLTQYTVKNYGHSYCGYLKGKLRFSGGGSLSQDFSYTRHHDNKAPDGAEYTEVPGIHPLTLYDMYKWKTGLYAPLSDEVSWQLSNVYTKWDMRLRESDGHQNTFTTSLTWNPGDDSGFSAYYQNLMYSFNIIEIDAEAADQHGLGLDWWHDTGRDISFSLGLFMGDGDNALHDFESLKLYGSLVVGPDDRWRLIAEYGDSSNEDYEVLDYDAFNAVLYYKIDI